MDSKFPLLKSKSEVLKTKFVPNLRKQNVLEKESMGGFVYLYPTSPCHISVNQVSWRVGYKMMGFFPLDYVCINATDAAKDIMEYLVGPMVFVCETVKCHLKDATSICFRK